MFRVGTRADLSGGISPASKQWRSGGSSIRTRNVNISCARTPFTKLLPDNQPSYAGRPSVCRNSGALIGAGETVCQVCDAPMVAVTPATLPLHERYAMSYARAVLSRPYIFTIVFLVANLFVFMLM